MENKSKRYCDQVCYFRIPEWNQIFSKELIHHGFLMFEKCIYCNHTCSTTLYKIKSTLAILVTKSKKCQSNELLLKNVTER